MSSNQLNNGPEIAPTAVAASTPKANGEKVLCQHCGRTATNGIKCRGWCLPDEY